MRNTFAIHYRSVFQRTCCKDKKKTNMFQTIRPFFLRKGNIPFTCAYKNILRVSAKTPKSVFLLGLDEADGFSIGLLAVLGLQLS